MTPKEKALSLIKKFSDHVNPYIGSGMLSNDHDDKAILWQSTACAIIAIKATIGREFISHKYWDEVKEEINKITVEEFLESKNQ